MSAARDLFFFVIYIFARMRIILVLCVGDYGTLMNVPGPPYINYVIELLCVVWYSLWRQCLSRSLTPTCCNILVTTLINTKKKSIYRIWYWTAVTDVQCSFITLEVHLVHTAQASSLPAVYGGHAIPVQVASTW